MIGTPYQWRSGESVIRILLTVNVDKRSGESVASISGVSPLVSDSRINSFAVSLYEVSELMTVVVDAAGADDDEP